MDSTEDSGSEAGAPSSPEPTDRRYDSGHIRYPFDRSDTHATDAVLRAVATASNTDPEALPTLYDVVETDALSALFDTSAWGPSDPSVVVTFEYAGYTVTVEGDGVVTVREAAVRTE